MNRNIIIGKKGEELACEYLKKKRYKIIERNWHYSKNAEIDIIADDNGTLVFIEVKTRTTLNYGHPFESITQSKIQKIYKGILGYLNQIDKKYKSYRFDGIAIIGLEITFDNIKAITIVNNKTIIEIIII